MSSHALGHRSEFESRSTSIVFTDTYRLLNWPSKVWIKTPATWTGYGQVAEIIFTADTFIV